MRPARTPSSPPGGTAGPVWPDAPGNMVSWPSFSSGVMSASSESATRWARGDVRRAGVGDAAGRGGARRPARVRLRPARGRRRQGERPAQVA
jgi:hypothetical protein